MEPKVKLYLMIGAAVLVAILVAVVAVVHLSGGDATTPATAAVVATAAAGAAAASRHRSRSQVAEARDTVTAGDILARKAADEAAAKMGAVEGEVKVASRDDKEKDGEALFGGDGDKK